MCLKLVGLILFINLHTTSNVSDCALHSSSSLGLPHKCLPHTREDGYQLAFYCLWPGSLEDDSSHIICSTLSKYQLHLHSSTSVPLFRLELLPAISSSIMLSWMSKSMVCSSTMRPYPILKSTTLEISLLTLTLTIFPTSLPAEITS